MSRIDETRPFIPLKIAVLAMSDTRSLAEDNSGSTLVERIEQAGHVVADGTIPEICRDTGQATLEGAFLTLMRREAAAS